MQTINWWIALTKGCPGSCHKEEQILCDCAVVEAIDQHTEPIFYLCQAGAILLKQQQTKYK